MYVYSNSILKDIHREHFQWRSASRRKMSSVTDKATVNNGHIFH